MVQDYVHYKKRHQKKPFLWRYFLFFFVLILLLLSFLNIGKFVFKHKKVEHHVNLETKVQKSPKQNQVTADLEDKLKASIQFDFRQGISQVSFVLPSEQATDDVNSQTQYLLHLGSWVNEQEARQYVRQLRKQGIYVHIVPAKQNGHFWYRVQFGPFETMGVAQKKREQLQAHSIHSILISVYRASS
jgi:cell division protein FtsN